MIILGVWAAGKQTSGLLQQDPLSRACLVPVTVLPVIQLAAHVLFAVSSSSPEMKLCYYLFLFLLLSHGNVIVFITTVTSLRKA